MAEYQGTAELLDRAGDVVDTVSVSLRSKPATQSSHGEWRGRIEPTDLGPANWDEAVSIRLPDGSEGSILVQRETVNSGPQGTTRAAQLLGSGPSPI